MKTSQPIALKFLAAQIRTNAVTGQRRVTLTFNSPEGIKVTGYGISGQQLDIANKEISGAFPGIKGLKDILLRQEEFVGLDLNGLLESDTERVDANMRPYVNLRLLPKAKNLSAADIAGLFEDDDSGAEGDDF